MANEKIEKLAWADFFVKNSKKILIGLISLAVVFLIFAGGLWYYYGVLNKDVVARVGDEVITKSVYDSEKDRCLAAAEYSKDDTTKASCSDEALGTQILIKSLEQEAKKRNLTIDDAKIDEQYNDFALSYGSETQMLSAMSQIKSTPESIKEAFRLELLKETLRPYLIAEKDVVSVFARWDWYNDPGYEGTTIEEAKQMALDKVNEYYVPLFNKSPFPSNEKIIAATAEFREENPIWEPEWRSRIFTMSGLNEVTSKDSFIGDADWNEISKTELGQVSQPVISDGGYVAIYKVTASNGGQYSSWEDYQSKVKASAKVYKISNLTNRVATFVSNFPLIGKALAADIACSTNHFSSLRITESRIYGSATPLTGITVTWGSSGTSGGVAIDGECPACTPNENCSGSFTTSTAKWYIGDADDTDKKWLSCWSRYNIDLSKSGYYSFHYNRRSTDVNGGTTNLDKTTAGDASYLQEWDGDSWEDGSAVWREANTDDNGYIYMRVRPSYTATLVLAGGGTGSVTASSANEIDCAKTSETVNATCSHSYEEKTPPYTRTLTAAAASGSVFSHWYYNGAVFYGSTFTLSMSSSQYVEAWFNKAPVACTITNYQAWKSPDGVHVGAGGTLNINTGDTVSYIGTSSNASSTPFNNGLGNSNNPVVFANAGTYTASYSCVGLYGGSGMTYTITIVATVNNAPTVTPTAPKSASGGHTKEAGNHAVFTSASSTPININANGQDPDGDKLGYHMAIVKSTDGGNTWLTNWTPTFGFGGSGTATNPWYYVNNPRTGAGNIPAGEAIIAAPTPSELGVGLYKWVVYVTDEHGLGNVNPPGSSNQYNHGDPWYFEVVDNTPLQVILDSPPASSIDPVTQVESGVITTSAVGGNADIPLVAHVIDTDPGQKCMDIYYQKDGDTTWHKSGTPGTITFCTSSPGDLYGTFNVQLPQGKYWWTAAGSSDTDAPIGAAEGARLLIVKDPVPTVSCDIVPTEGTTPFTIRYTYNIVNPVSGQSLVIDFGSSDVPVETTSLASGTIFRTYNNPSPAGGYQITTTYPGGTMELCNAKVIVNNANDDDGGEVIPQ